VWPATDRGPRAAGARAAEVNANSPDLPAAPPNLSLVRVPVGALGRRWWSAGLPLSARRRGVALFHGTNFEVPLWGGAARVLTVHDLSLLVRPETHERRRVRRARLRLPLMARRADAVVTPAFGTVAYPHVEAQDMAAATLLIDGAATPYGAQIAWPAVATFANLPATSAPIGRTPQGLPIGMQVIGPFLHDRTTIAVAGWLNALQES